MNDKSAAERIVDCLAQAGIGHFFGMPVGATMEIYKALHGREDDIRAIVPRDETSHWARSLTGNWGQTHQP